MKIERVFEACELTARESFVERLLKVQFVFPNAIHLRLHNFCKLYHDGHKNSPTENRKTCKLGVAIHCNLTWQNLRPFRYSIRTIETKNASFTLTFLDTFLRGLTLIPICQIALCKKKCAKIFILAIITRHL